MECSVSLDLNNLKIDLIGFTKPDDALRLAMLT
jgi:hypothetical protein